MVEAEIPCPGALLPLESKQVAGLLPEWNQSWVGETIRVVVREGLAGGRSSHERLGDGADQGKRGDAGQGDLRDRRDILSAVAAPIIIPPGS